MVDDRPANLIALEAVLEPLDQNLVRAASGQEALDRLAEDDYALILLDVQMPGLDGFETAARIRRSERNADTPIFFITAIHREIRDIERGYAVGALDYVEKPFEPAVLRAKVAALLDLRRKERRLADSEERFRRAFDDAPIGMALVGPEGALLRVNAALERLTGRDRAWLLRRTLRDLTHPDDLVGEIIRSRRLAEGNVDCYTFEKRLVHAAGRDVWVNGSVSAVREPSGVPSYYVHQIEDVSERKAAEAELARRALHDGLTGLANRILFTEHLGRATMRLRRIQAPLGVLVVNLDRFKAVNDLLGHGAGDRVLTEVAGRLEGLFRATDTVARLGGDTFCLLSDGMDSELDVAVIADRVHVALAEPLRCDGSDLELSASVGVAVVTSAGADPEQLMRDAEAAMHQSKLHGPGGTCIYDAAMQERARSQREMETELGVALERGEFRLVYQPKVSLATGAIVGAEALVRWDRPHHGMIAPDVFIPIAERSGLIVPLGAWILEEACRQAAAWQLDLPDRPPLGVGINLSGRQLLDPELTATVANAIALSGLDPALVDLEITESVLMEDSQANDEVLRRLKELGVTMSIDDFGTGYSSLSYLKRFPVEVLKVDRSFVDGLPDDREDSAIMAAVIALGHALELTIVAEGVETPEQRDALVALGCELAQGYLFARPLTPEDLLPLLRADAALPAAV